MIFSTPASYFRRRAVGYGELVPRAPGRLSRQCTGKRAGGPEAARARFSCVNPTTTGGALHARNIAGTMRSCAGALLAKVRSSGQAITSSIEMRSARSMPARNARPVVVSARVGPRPRNHHLASKGRGVRHTFNYDLVDSPSPLLSTANLTSPPAPRRAVKARPLQSLARARPRDRPADRRPSPHPMELGARLQQHERPSGPGGAGHNSPYSPSSGYSYDGLYLVEDY